MERSYTCNECNTQFTGNNGCPQCNEKEHSAKMNQEAVERIKKETISQEEANRIEGVFFEDDAEVTLRDGKTYRIPPCSLKKARRLMILLKTVNIDVIMFNFLPPAMDSIDEYTDVDAIVKQKEDDLFEILSMAFSNYKHIDKDYIEEYVDVELAGKIITILIGLNGLKK